MKRWIAATGAAVVALATIIIGAPGAQAGVDPTLVSVVLSGDSCVLSSGSVTGNPGAAFTIAVSVDCKVIGFDGTAAPVSPSLVSARAPGGQVTFSLTSLGSGGLVIGAATAAGANYAERTLNVNVIDTYVPLPMIHDDLQQVGVPASGDCSDVPISVGHYPGFPIGGWSKSWAKWIYDGRGGPVCTRELEEIPNGTVILVG